MLKRCTCCRRRKRLTEFLVRKGYGGRKAARRPECKKCAYARTRAWLAKNPGYRQKRYVEKHGPKRKPLTAEEKIQKRHDLYLKNRKRVRKLDKLWQKKDGPAQRNHKIAQRLRTRQWYALKGRTKTGATRNLLGCSFKELCAHLKSLFKKGMAWKNYGLWQIDHIRPCASFDLRKPAQQRACFHYTNLQPLWRIENLQKGARV